MMIKILTRNKRRGQSVVEYLIVAAAIIGAIIAVVQGGLAGKTNKVLTNATDKFDGAEAAVTKNIKVSADPLK